MAQVTESDYRLAQEDPRLRQEFIESIDLGDANKLINQIRYVHKKEISQDYGGAGPNTEYFMAFSYIIGHINFNLGKTCLEVYKNAFSDPFYYFMNSFLHHEMHHARQISLDSGRQFTEKLINEGDEFEGYVELITEIPAFYNQLAIGGEFSLRESEISNFHSDILPKLDRNMKRQARKLKRKWKNDLSQILCLSPYDNIVREIYKID